MSRHRAIRNLDLNGTYFVFFLVIDLDYLDEEDDDSYEEPIEGSPLHSFSVDNRLDQLSVEDAGICPSRLFCVPCFNLLC